MNRHALIRCRCGASVIWGDAATEEEAAAWEAEHRACLPLKIHAREVCPLGPPYQHLVEDITGAPLLAWIGHVDVQGHPVELVVFGPVLEAALALAYVEPAKAFLGARGAASVEVFTHIEERLRGEDGAVLEPAAPAEPLVVA